jgi:hypothetical protein
MATYNGQPAPQRIAGARLELEDGTDALLSFPPDPAARVRGLELDDEEGWFPIASHDDGTVDIVLTRDAQVGRRRRVRAVLRRVRNATRDGEVAAPADVQRLLLALAAEVFGDD